VLALFLSTVAGLLFLLTGTFRARHPCSPFFFCCELRSVVCVVVCVAQGESRNGAPVPRLGLSVDDRNCPGGSVLFFGGVDLTDH